MADTGHKTTAELRGLLKYSQTAEEKSLADTGRLSAHGRMARLFDEGTFVEVGAYIGRKRTELDREADDSFEPVVTGYGAVDGTLVYAFSQDFSRLHGALGEMHAKKITNILKMAERSHAPVIGIFDSAGAKILEGVDALAGYGSIMNAVSAAELPKIAVVSGICGGASAVIAEMFDIVIAAEKSGRLFASPSGSAAPEAAADAGLIDILCEDDAASIRKARALIPYFGGSMTASDDINRAAEVDALLAVPNYDIHDIIHTVFDADSFTELGAGHADSMVTGLAAMNGRPVGVIANNPAVKDGRICPCAADKATRMLNICRMAKIPAVTLADTAGIADSAHAEQKGLASHLARLARAYAKAGDASVTVTLGASFGTAYTVMGSKSLTGGVALALDRAKIAAMTPDSAVAFLDEVKDESRHHEIAGAWAEKYASPLEAAKSGHIDDIIDSRELRQRIGAALEMLCF